MALPTLGTMPTPTLPVFSNFKAGPAQGLAEIRNSLSASMAGIEDVLPDVVKNPLATARGKISGVMRRVNYRPPARLFPIFRISLPRQVAERP
jgi:hypothetical protein